MGHIRVFGFVAHANIDSHLLKKLDDRSQALVHLGIEPGSKAYRLYNPSSKELLLVEMLFLMKKLVGIGKQLMRKLIKTLECFI